jgi:hypothetical protein
MRKSSHHPSGTSPKILPGSVQEVDKFPRKADGHEKICSVAASLFEA